MTSVFHNTHKTSGWRFRRLNDETVYSIDLNEDSLREATGESTPTYDGVSRFLVEDFCKKVQNVKTPIIEWVSANANRPQNFMSFIVECDKLKNNPDKNSVRSARIPSGSRLRVYEMPNELLEKTFVVLILRQKLFDVRTNQMFKEFTILGVLPWQRQTEIVSNNETKTIGFDSVILNTNIASLTSKSLELLRNCNFSNVDLSLFGDEDVASTADCSMPTTEQLISFCIRWHVARKGKQPTFFQHVIGTAQQVHASELDEQLFGLTVKYFKNASAAQQLFANRKFFSSVVFLWNRNVIPIYNRLWMQRQFIDAIEYLIDKHVVSIGLAACTFFVRDTVVPSLAYFMPHVSVVEQTSQFLVVDFFSLSRCALQVNFYELVLKFDQHTLEGEQPMKIDAARLFIPLSSACRLVTAIYRAAMSKLISVEKFSTETSPNEEWLVDETVLPFKNTDIYAASRTVRYDDFPINGQVCRKLSTSSNSTSQSADVLKIALSSCNLPQEFGLLDSRSGDTNNDDDNDPEVSIPLRNSNAVIRVSRHSIDEVCSSSVPDMEDLVDRLQENPCMNLHRNNAIPLCARTKSSVFVNTSDQYLLYNDRFFLYKFFASLELHNVSHNDIVEFMLKNSSAGVVEKKHRRELDAMPRNAINWRRKNAHEGNEQFNENEEEHSSVSRSLGSCYTIAARGFCPYTKMAQREEGADAAFAALMKKIDHPLKDNLPALQRIAASTRNTGNIKAGCMQEYVEMRTSQNSSILPKAHPDLTFDRPKHYVLACAEYHDRAS